MSAHSMPTLEGGGRHFPFLLAKQFDIVAKRRVVARGGGGKLEKSVVVKVSNHYERVYFNRGELRWGTTLNKVYPWNKG